MTKLRAFAIAAPAFILVAAAPAPYSPSDPGFGSTIDAMIAEQAIEMVPQYAGVPIEGGNGRRASQAYRRYLTGNVKQLLKVSGDGDVGTQGGAREQIVTTVQPNQ